MQAAGARVGDKVGAGVWQTRERIAGKYTACQLFCWLAFEWDRKTLKREIFSDQIGTFPTKSPTGSGQSGRVGQLVRSGTDLTGSESATRNRRKRLAFEYAQREDSWLGVMFQPGQLVSVNLAGLQAEGVMFQAAVTDAVAHIVNQTSEQPPKYLVRLLFSFRGVTEVEVPADRIHADKKME